MTYTFTDREMERLREAMDRAPSIFRQHPWYLRRVADDQVELYSVPDERHARLSELLPREVVISCGAALYNLRLAIRVASREPALRLLPDLGQNPRLLNMLTAGPTLLASIEVMPGRPSPPTMAHQEMYEAIWLRRTDRWPYRQLPVPPPILMEMENAAARERGWLRVLHGRQLRQALRAVRRANRDPLLNSLTGLNAVLPDDYGPTPEGNQPLTRPDFWRRGSVARFENLRHAQLLSLATDDDRPLDWLRAGEALQRALLQGTRFSMSALGGRSTPYRQEPEYGPFGRYRFGPYRLWPYRLWPHPSRPYHPVPAGYAVEVTFLTQFLELADLIAQQAPPKAPDRVNPAALELADLEGLELADKNNHQARRNGELRWPWRSYFTEIPQVLMRVGYAPAEREDGAVGSYRGEPIARPGHDVPYADPIPRSFYEAANTEPIPRHLHDEFTELTEHFAEAGHPEETASLEESERHEEED